MRTLRNMGRRHLVSASIVAVFGLAAFWLHSRGEQAAVWQGWARESGLGLSFATPPRRVANVFDMRIDLQPGGQPGRRLHRVLSEWATIRGPPRRRTGAPRGRGSGTLHDTRELRQFGRRGLHPVHHQEFGWTKHRAVGRHPGGRFVYAVLFRGLGCLGKPEVGGIGALSNAEGSQYGGSYAFDAMYRVSNFANTRRFFSHVRWM